AEDALAEETAWLGLEGPVVDGFRILDLAAGPFADAIGRCDGDGNGVKRVLPVKSEKLTRFAGGGFDAAHDGDFRCRLLEVGRTGELHARGSGAEGAAEGVRMRPDVEAERLHLLHQDVE